MTPSRSQSTASRWLSDMTAVLLHFIRLPRLIFRDKLLGGAFRDDGAVFQTDLTGGLDELFTVAGYPGGNDQRHFNLPRLPQPDFDAGGQAGVAGCIGDVTHCSVRAG